MALHENEKKLIVICDGISVPISHDDALYFPKVGITKGDLARYYGTMAPHIFTYAANHLLTMERYPGGIEEEGFYQKEAPPSAPRFISRKTIRNKTGGITTYCTFNHPAVLVYLAQYGCITPHIWLSTATLPIKPDRIIFDLDPPKVGEVAWSLIADTAFELRELLLSVGLEPFLMTTGSRGLHVVVPIVCNARFDKVRTVARNVARILVTKDPRNKTLNAQDPARTRKLFIDYLRNGFGATAVAPYAVRARPNASVATPISWQELEDSALRSNTFTLHDIPKRIAHHDDPWASFTTKHRSLF